MFKPSMKEDCRVRACQWSDSVSFVTEQSLWFRKAVCLFQAVGVSESKRTWPYWASQVPARHVASSQTFCGWQLLVENRLKY